MEGKIVYQGKTKQGEEIIIRYPLISDAQKMTDYINTLSDEKTYISYRGEHETLESETKYLVGQLENIKNKKCVQLLVFVNGELAGNAAVTLGKRVERHLGLIAISVDKRFRGSGVGKLLMENLLKEAEKELSELEIFTLYVYAQNKLAYEWYKRLGFIENGTLPKGLKLEDGNYDDHISMYKTI